MRERLKDLVDANGGPTVVAAGSNLPKSTLDKYMGGHSEPPATRLARIAAFCGSTSDWIISGNRTSHPTFITPASGTDVALIPRWNVEVSAGLGRENYDQLPAGRVPIARSLLASLDVDEQHAHFVTAAGDSMLETIADGDSVLVNTADQVVRREGIYVVSIGDRALIKRVQIVASMNAVRLISDNARYEPEIAQLNDHNFRVIGRARLVLRVL